MKLTQSAWKCLGYVAAGVVGGFIAEKIQGALFGGTLEERWEKEAALYNKGYDQGYEDAKTSLPYEGFDERLAELYGGPSTEVIFDPMGHDGKGPAESDGAVVASDNPFDLDAGEAVVIASGDAKSAETSAEETAETVSPKTASVPDPTDTDW